MKADMNFSYEVFDRQTETVIEMAAMLAANWKDYGTTELSIDLKSLELKASRLCAMTDTDMAVQQQELIHSRTVRNIELASRMEELLNDKFCPLVNCVLEEIKNGGQLEGRKWPMFPSAISQLLPLLSDCISEFGIDTTNWNELIASTGTVEKALRKKLKPPKFPGMPGIERFWLLYEIFALLSYLLYHFKSLTNLCKSELTEADAGKLLQEAILSYADSEEGDTELSRYLSALKFDHDGSLTIDSLTEARKRLRDEVPQQLQLTFMRDINNIDTLAVNMSISNSSAEDCQTFIEILAKWQMLTQMIESARHPGRQKPALYNEVFNTMIHDRCIDLYDLRERIRRMCRYVTRKNHWFCVWSVLYHNNLIKNRNFEAFARQMCDPDWFGNDKDIQSFTGDTLRDYKSYFTERHYTMWNTREFRTYRELHGKTKWSPDLCDKFLRLCLQMNEELCRN